MGEFWHPPARTPDIGVFLPSPVLPGRGKRCPHAAGGSSALETPSLPQTHSAGDRGTLGVWSVCAGDPPPQKLQHTQVSPWGSVPAPQGLGVAGGRGRWRGGGWEWAPVAGGDSGGLWGGWSRPPPAMAPVGSRGAGAGGGRWISTLGWGLSPVGFAQLPVSHGRRAGEAAGARGSGAAVGAPGVRGLGQRQPRARLQRAAGGSAPGSAASPQPAPLPHPAPNQPGGAVVPPGCVLAPRRPG